MYPKLNFLKYLIIIIFYKILQNYFNNLQFSLLKKRERKNEFVKIKSKKNVFFYYGNKYLTIYISFK